MKIYGHILPGAARLANWAARTNLTEKAKHRLRVVDWLKNHNGDISLAARHFGLDRKTVRTWRDKFNKIGMLALNDKSHRPKNVRCPTTGWEIVAEIVRIRKKYPAWSKYKIRAMLKRKSMFVSASTIGRVLKRKNLINSRVSKKKSKAAKNPKQRYPKGMRIISAGDMIQIDTKFVTLLGGRIIYQFTAIDVLTKRRVLKFYSSLLSKNGADFLRYCLRKFPFPIKSIQTDNGKEFLKDFDKLCQKLSLPHYFIEPRHPKQNTYVENSHGFDEREFYQQGNVDKDIEAMDKSLEKWEYQWNHIRPHQALNYLTPDEYFNQIKLTNLKAKEAIILQT
ncbi:DDE-type integrase/transposase/recombinase [Patescibacteria group bacterium]|nr:DDE-type integrase/transposase/recombinase [Patescibacteria group bacterium]